MEGEDSCLCVGEKQQRQKTGLTYFIYFLDEGTEFSRVEISKVGICGISSPEFGHFTLYGGEQV